MNKKEEGKRLYLKRGVVVVVVVVAVCLLDVYNLA